MVVVGWDRWRWGVGRVLINGSQGPSGGPDQGAFDDFKLLIHEEIHKYILNDKKESSGRNNLRRNTFLQSLIEELNEIWEKNMDFDTSRGFCSRTLAFRQ